MSQKYPMYGKSAHLLNIPSRLSKGINNCHLDVCKVYVLRYVLINLTASYSPLCRILVAGFFIKVDIYCVSISLMLLQ